MSNTLDYDSRWEEVDETHAQVARRFADAAAEAVQTKKGDPVALHHATEAEMRAKLAVKAQAAKNYAEARHHAECAEEHAEAAYWGQD